MRSATRCGPPRARASTPSTPPSDPASSGAAVSFPSSPSICSAGARPCSSATAWHRPWTTSGRRSDDDRRGAAGHPRLPRLQGQPHLRGDAHHLPAVPEGLPDPRRHPGDAHQRGAALDSGHITAVILAGGQGTRLRPLTNSHPKSVVPLLNIPFLAYQLALLRRHGVERAVLSCSYLVDEVRRIMGDGTAWGVRLDYAVEAEPLGTAGGVRNAADLLGDTGGDTGGDSGGDTGGDLEGGLVVVLNGDVLTDVHLSDMLRFHAERGARATIFLTRVSDPGPYGLVELAGDGRVTRFVEKPGPAERTANTVNAGIYVLDSALLARIPPGRVASMEREFFPGLLGDGLPFFGWIGDGYWIDIGSPEKYRQAQLDLLKGRVATDVGPAGGDGGRRSIAADAVLGARVSATAPLVIGAGCRLEDDCRVGPSAVLGPGCVVGTAATIEGAVLWERVSVGAGAVLRNCIIGADVRVGPHAHVGPGVVLEDGAVVASSARVVP